MHTSLMALGIALIGIGVCLYLRDYAIKHGLLDEEPYDAP